MARKWVNRALGKFGLQLVSAGDDQRLALVDLLRQRGVDHVIDVGANTGQFAQQLLDKGFAGTIHCIEPLSDAHRLLSQRFAGNSRVHVLARMAAGAESGEASINIARNSVSSSLLPMEDAHVDAAPRSVYVSEERVFVEPIASIFAQTLGSQEQRILLKIDAQGYEGEVLKGAAGLLPHIDAVLVEMSTTELYTGQVDWTIIHQRLAGAGFALWNLLPDFRDRQTGRLLQFDGLYVRPD
uniref:FkbM family methyltransferase n=1 Tax=Parerythrobacter lutipelagi TaxID=1964208 RepID=UPI001375D823|nr:FkbM family methyltransferase [Parerythrobacter lutipelagi]